jgi:hypothetical protein
MASRPSDNEDASARFAVHDTFVSIGKVANFCWEMFDNQAARHADSKDE